MGLINSLRETEKQSREAVRKKMQLARETLEDAERRIRRKMRIYPSKIASPATTNLNSPSTVKTEKPAA